jgi:hypothetical protein
LFLAVAAVALGTLVIGDALIARSSAPIPVGLPTSASATTSTPAWHLSPPAPPDMSAVPDPEAFSATPGPPPPDLHVSGPAEVTLTSYGDGYRGTVTFGVTDTGVIPPGVTELTFGLPAGVSIDFSNAPAVGRCVETGPPSIWVCEGDPVPSVGLTYTIQLVAKSYAPEMDGLTITDFDVTVFAHVGSTTDLFGDLTPDNELSVKVRLAL